MKKLVFVLFLLFAANQANATIVSLYIGYQFQPLQNITIASCDTLVIYNQTNTQSYTVHNDIVPGPEPGPVIAAFYSTNNTYLYFDDLTSYANLTVRYQIGTELFNITITPGPQSTINQTICQGSSYLFGGEERTISGTYLSYIPTGGPGCDSLVTLELTVLPAITDTFTVSICHEETYTYNGIEQYTSGNYADTLQTANGCDSIVTLHLIVRGSIQHAVYASICEGDSTTYMGNIYTSPGAHEFHFPAQNGCDSTVTFYVINTLGPQLTVTQTDANSLHVSSTTTSGFLWLDCNDNYASTGITAADFNAVENGSYAVTATYNGCVDTSECLQISQVGLEETASAEISIYPVPTDNLLTIKTTGNPIGTPFYIMDLSGKAILEGTTMASETTIAIGHLASGIYVLRMDGEMLRIIRE